MTYWFLTSGNSQRDYSTFFEASTKCYPPLVESPLCGGCVSLKVKGQTTDILLITTLTYQILELTEEEKSLLWIVTGIIETLMT